MFQRPASADDAVLGVQPGLVYEPATPGEAAEALRESAARRQRIAVVGGRSALGLGNPPTGLEALVDTRRLSRIVDHSPADQVVVAEAGVTLATLQRTCAAHGQRLGLDAPHADRATLGGLLSTAAFGPRRASFGALRELVIGVTLVRADGAEAKSGGKVVKNVAGYDLPKLVCGSLGTLAMIARVNLRLHPLPERSSLWLLPGLLPEQLTALQREVRAAFLEPAAAVALADCTGRYQLGLLFEGFAAGVTEQGARLEGLAGRVGAECAAADEAHTAAFFGAHDEARTRGTLRARLAALPTALPQVDRLVRPLLELLPAASFAWYPTLGLGFLSGDLAAASADPGAPALDRLRAALTQARTGLGSLGGSLVFDALPAPLRGHLDPWGPVPASFSLMQRLKAAFDPEGRLNPGRFLGGL